MQNAKSPSFLSTTLQAIENYLKPHRAEALQRIRLNGFCLLLVAILTNLLPVPSIQTALRVVLSTGYQERWTSDWMYRWFCIAEVAGAIIFAFNLFEGLYAVNYPRPPLPPYASPAKTKAIFKSDPTPQRPFKILSPNTSPQPQKPFSFPSSSSFSSSTSKYPTSPLSTPSRVLQYPALSASSTNTQASSTSTVPLHATPSPVISTYRAKHLNRSVGRALDESFLGRLAPEDSDEDN